MGEVTLPHAPYNAHPFLMRVLLTRPLAQSEGFAAQIRARYGEVVETAICPLVEIVFLPVEVDFSGFDAVVFTSQNGVAAYHRLGGPARLSAYCVGDRTAQAARGLGMEAFSADGDVRALNALVAKKANGAKLAHLSGRDVAGKIDGNITRIEAYYQAPVEPSPALQALLAHDDTLIVPLFSAQGARRFGAAIGQGTRAGLHAICMSKAVADQLDPAQFKEIRHDGPPTAKGMLDKMSDFFPP